MKSRIPKATLIIWSIIIVIAIAVAATCTVLFVQGKWGTLSVNKDNFVVVKKESLEQIPDSVVLNWVSGNVEIKKSEDNKVRIVQKGNADFPSDQLFDAKMNGNELVVADRRGYAANIFGYQNQQDTDLELYLPEVEYQHLVGDFTSTDVTLEASYIATLELKTISGTIDTVGGQYGQMILSTTSGNMHINGAQISEKINMTSSSGYIEVKQCVVQGDLYGYTTSGAIVMSELNAPNIKCETVSNSIKVQGDLTKATMGTTSGKLELATNTPLEELKVYSVSGSLYGTIPQRNGFTASYVTTSGTFHSNLPIENTEGKIVYGDGTGVFEFHSTSGNVDLNLK